MTIEDEEIIIEPGTEPLSDAGDSDVDCSNPIDESKENSNDMSSCQFDLHEDSVYTTALHPRTSTIAASGSGDEILYIWNTITGELMARCNGHKESIVALEFSSNGEMLASGCMEGILKITNTKEDSPAFGSNISDFEIGSEIVWIQWHLKGPVLLVGTVGGSTWMYSAVSNQIMQIFVGHSGAVTSGSFFPKSEGKKVITISEDGSCIVFDPKTGQQDWRQGPENAHFSPGEDSGWTSLDTNEAGTIAVLGSSSGRVRVINLTKGNVVASLDHHTDSIEQIRWSWNKQLVSCASVDGTVSIWDSKTWVQRCLLKHPDAITCMNYAQNDEYIITASVDGNLYVWNCLSGDLLATLTGHTDAILSMSSDETAHAIVTGSDDKTCRVFHIEIS